MKSQNNPLGIAQKDYEIFTLLNELGALPASTVATRLHINRTTAFSALKRLIEKGLVFEVPSSPATLFAAIEPQQIIDKAERDIARQTRELSVLSLFAKELIRKRGRGAAIPQLSFYEGEEGIISLFEKTLSLGKEQCAFLTLEKIPAKILKYLTHDYITQKKKKQVFSRVLVPQSARAKKYAALDESGNRETRFVPKDSPFETEILISGNTIVLFDFRGPIGVCIESEALANTLKTVFELVWEEKK